MKALLIVFFTSLCACTPPHLLPNYTEVTGLHHDALIRYENREIVCFSKSPESLWCYQKAVK